MIESLEKRKYAFVTDEEQLRKLAAALMQVERFSFDVETSGLDPRNDVISGFSVCPKPGVAFYVPIRHDALVVKQIDPATAWAIMKEPLTTKKVVCHNRKFDDRMVRFDKAAGYALGGTEDTMVMAYCTGQFENMAYGDGEESRVSAGLKNVVSTCYGYKMLEIWDLFPGISKRRGELLDFTKLPLSDDLLRYTCEDADMTMRLFLDLWPKIKDSFTFNLESDLIEPNAAIEDVGVKVDVGYMQASVSRLTTACEEVRKAIVADVRERTGKPVDFDPKSPQQCGTILFEELKLPVAKRSDKTGRPCTDKNSLESLAASYPVVRNILTFRQMQKQVTGFFNTLPDYVYPDTQRIHCDYLQCHVGSGRFASADPNLQNLSKPKHWDLLDSQGLVVQTYVANLRDAFVSDGDYVFIESDYSQIEARILASLSGDVQLLDVFLNGKDYHIKTAVFCGIASSESACTKEQRSKGKTINYALAYGLGPKGYAQRYGCSLEEAQRINVDYFAGYASLRPWTDKTIRAYKTAGGKVTTVFGRIRHVPEYHADNEWVRVQGERSAANTVIQGTAADIQKISLVRLVSRCRDFGWDKMRPCMHTHDSNVVLVHKSVPIQQAIDVIRSAMLFKTPLRVPMDVDHSIGFKLGSMVSWKPDIGVDFDARVVSGKKKEVDVINDSVVGSAVEEGSATSGKSSRFILKMHVMPTVEQAAALKAVLETFPGDNVLTLQTPQGNQSLAKFPTSLTVSDAAKFQLVLPCEVLLERDTVTLDTLGVKL